MSYILTTTNKVRFDFYSIPGGDTQTFLIFNARSNLEFEALSKEYVLANQEIVTDYKGIRVFIDIALHNHPDLNDNYNVWAFLNSISYLQQDLLGLRVYPMYEADKELDSLDVFDCILDEFYSIEKLHEFLDSGTNINLKFKTRSPCMYWSPKHPIDLGSYTSGTEFTEILGTT